jgi:hypothetical protein
MILKKVSKRNIEESEFLWKLPGAAKAHRSFINYEGNYFNDFLSELIYDEGKSQSFELKDKMDFRSIEQLCRDTEKDAAKSLNFKSHLCRADTAYKKDNADFVNNYSANQISITQIKNEVTKKGVMDAILKAFAGALLSLLPEWLKSWLSSLL